MTVAILALLTAPACAVTFDWATIGDPGNVDDVHGDGYGGVNYTYRISKYEVTNAQYTEFLNAVAAADPNGLYNTSMGASAVGTGLTSGITRSGTPGAYAYSVMPDALGEGPGGADGEDYSRANKPVTYVSFFDAMRFVNWLANGQPTGAQGLGTTEDGVYRISNGLIEARDPKAKFFLPSEDEWYKAAFYDPHGNGGSGVYYDYPTSTDAIPNSNPPSADTGNSANFYYATGNSYYPLTDVGAYKLSASPYGTFDQGGNVWEWNEAVIDSSSRGIRGNSYNGFSNGLRAAARPSQPPWGESGLVGFRVASVPEPSAALLVTAAAIILLMQWRRVCVGRLRSCA